MRQFSIRPVVFAAAVGLLAASCAASAASADIEAAFKAFWGARTPQDAANVIPDLLRSGVTVDEAMKRLKAGRPYSAIVPKGVVKASYKAHGKEFFYAVNVPVSYDPAQRYQVRFQLHGGVMRPSNQPRGDGSIGALAGDDQFYIIPYAWADAPWWDEEQLDNLAAILDTVKRTYNVDENRVVLAGVSDGGTGAFYIAMRKTTPFASFLPLNGNMLVLRSEDIHAGDLFPNNLRNKPWFVVNGGRDRCIPRAGRAVSDHLKKRASTSSTSRNPTACTTPRGGLRSKTRSRRSSAIIRASRRARRSPGRHRHADRQSRRLAGHRQARAEGAQRTGPARCESADRCRADDLRPHAAIRASRLVRSGNTVTAATTGGRGIHAAGAPDAFDRHNP